MKNDLQIEGCAIVSEDGMVADSHGIMPETLKLEADQKFFESLLRRADVLIHGAHSFESPSPPRSRRRLILTRQIATISDVPSNENARYWNPQGAPLLQALASLGVQIRRICVIGGTNAYGAFLDLYDAFYLTQAPHVRLPGGRPVFPGVPAQSPQDVLSAHGLTPCEEQLIDPENAVSLTTWKRRIEAQ